MNKNCFRVIFSKTLQCLVVTSELAKTEGKSTERASSPFPQLFAKIQSLTFSFFCALGFVSFSSTVSAELIIQADKSAPKTQQPIVLQTANGLPQVNIQTPNEQGLSHNKYSKFDVDTKGAILNNSRTNVQTQQGGWVQGNPYLARGEAKVILNEVNSSDPSVLKGYVEVAGKKADVIIANPSGIHCDGCGVINSDRTTLTTGKPQIQQGNLESFVVEKGKVSVSGKGLDNSRVDYTEIIAREAQINAGVWSKKEMKAITGKNTVKRSGKPEDLQIVRTNQATAQETKPQVAIDVGQLGGMYAGKIHLIGTEQGVGVHNAGHIGANADTLKIDSQGRIVNSGTLNANKPVQLSGTKGIENTGKIENRQGDITLNSKSDIKQDGVIVARAGNIHKTAERGITQQGESIAKGNIRYNAPSVTASTRSLIAAGVDVKDTAEGEKRSLENLSAQGKTIAINSSGKATLQGRNLASGKINVEGANVNLDKSHTSAYSININGTQGEIEANDAFLIAQRDLTLKTPTALQTQNSYLKADKISTQQRSLNTKNATWEQTGTSAFSINTADQLQNQGGTFKTQGDFSVNAQGIDNRRGRFIANGKLTVDAGKNKVDSTGGALVSTQALSLASGELVNDGGLIQSQKSIRLNTQGQRLSNQQTLTDSQDKGIVTLGELEIHSADLANQKGRLIANGKLTVDAGKNKVDSTGGVLVSSQALSLTSGELVNDGGLIQSQKSIRLNTQGQRLSNQQTLTDSQDKGIVTLGELNIHSADLMNLQGRIVSGGNQQIKATEMNNTQGLMRTAQALNLVAQSVQNHYGAISAKSTASLSVENTFAQVGGQLGANALILNAGNLNSTDKSLIAADRADIQVLGKFNHQQSRLNTLNDLTIQSQALNNTLSTINSVAGNIKINTQQQQLNNSQGHITAKGHIELDSGELQNQGGSIYSQQDIRIDTHNQLLNNQQTQGEYQGILSQGNLTIHANKLDNTQGSLSAKSSQLNVTELINRLGILQNRDDLLLHTQRVDNTEGMISGAQKVVLAIRDLFTQKAGKIGAGELVLNAGAVDSTEKSLIVGDNVRLTVKGKLTNANSEISATQNLAITSQALNNQRGLLLAERGNLIINSQQYHLNNQHGKIVAGQKIHLDSGALDNQQGLVQGQTGILLNTYQQYLNNTLGHIVSQQDLTIASGELNNRQGYIQSAKQGNIQLGSSSLHNQQGVISTGANLRLNAGTVSNHDGVIDAKNHLDANLSNLYQKNGIVQAGQSVNVTANGEVLSTNHSQIIGENLNITTSGQFDNQQSNIIARNSGVIRSGQLNNHEANLIAEQGNLEIHTKQQNLTNQLGKLSAGANLAINSGELDNRQGLIQSRQNMAIHTHQGQLNNQQTQEQNKGVISLGELALTTQDLLNQNGYLLSQQDQIINAHSIHNDSGILSSLASQNVTVSNAISNIQGRISSVSATVSAQSIDNQAGLIQGNHQLTIQTRDNINNEEGQVKAGEKLAIQTRGLNNHKGQVRAIEGGFAVSAIENINNTLGYLTAKQQATITADGLNNHKGVVYNEQGLLNLKLQQNLDNQQGEVIAKENLKIESASLLNQQGKIYAEKQSNIGIKGLIDNQQNGKIYGMGETIIHANQVDNRGGEIRTQDKLVLNVTTGINNQKVGNTGSFIESGNELILNTADLNNSQTKSAQEKMTQGILASSLKLSARLVDNHQGKIHSRGQGDLSIQQTLDNRQGDVTGGSVSLEGKNLRIDNQGGRLQADKALSILANEVTTNGHIEGQDVSITQQKDFVTANSINADRNLRISTAGNLINQHNLYADESVALDANHITNHVAGRISSANTQLSAKGNLINEGLINGVSLDDQAKTIVKVGGQLINTGKGRIYGDHIALEADRIENSDKNYGNEIKSAIIAARGDLDISAREIENNTAHYLSDHQVGATLFSIGEMRFGRTLNANHQAEGKAEVLRNNSSVIESEGSIRLNVNQIHNNNTHFTVEHVKTGKKPNNITKLDEKTVNETYIVPKGRNERWTLKTDYTNPLNGDKSKINLDDPHIPMKLLRWAGWSRAGKLVYKSDGAAPVLLKPGDVITADTPLAIRNEMTCDYMNGGPVCNYTPEGQYGKDSPIWAYFGVPAPQEPQPKFPFDELAEQSWFKESDWFDEEGNFKRPTKPRKFFWTNPEVYKERLIKWNYYVANIKPLEDWENKYRHSINTVDNGIERHNKARLGSLRGKEYKEFWQLHITNRRKDESKVLTTVPGQILAGGDIEVHNQSFINERSVVVAGQKMSLENQIQNIDEKGLHRVTDTGDKVFTFDKWRGGFKRYFQRKWENHGDYTRIIETPFDMKIFKVVENGDYDVNKKTDDKLKNSTTHQLALTQVKVNNDGLSSLGNLALGTLGAGDLARFTQLGGDARQVDKLSAWSGKGQSVEFKTLNGRLEGFQSLPGTTTNSTARPLERITLNENQEVRSIRPNLVIPQNVLYRVNANPNNRVLIETDPDFTSQKRWLSSDYMFKALRYEPNQMQKRLGDGFYEQRLVREQINRLTGRNFVGNYSDFDSQYKGLMDAGVTFAQKFNLRPGIALSPSQVAKLTSDIVWLEAEQVSLQNGKVESVLVPKVYAVARKGDITGNGALLSGNRVSHKGGEFINNGTVAGRELVQFDSETIRNSGKISGGALVGNVRGDMDNLGGALEADKAILLNVAGNFNHSSTTHTTSVNVDGYQRSDTRIGRKGLLHVKGENGTLQIQANNINLGGADIINDGKGQTYLSAKNNLNLTALSVGFDEKMGGGNHYRNERKDGVEISRVKGGGDVRLAAKNIYSQGAELESEARLAALAENDLVLNGAKVSHDFEEFHKTKSGSLAKVTKTSFDKQQSETQRGTQVSGEAIILAAGNDVTGTGLQAIAENDLLIQAGGNVDISADTNHFRNIHKETKKTSGVFTSGGGITFGSKSEKHHLESEGWTQSDARSTLGSMNGDIQIQAGKHAKVMGTDLITPRTNRIDIEGAAVKVEAGKDLINTSERHEYKQSGLTLAVSTPVTDMAQAAYNSVKRSEQVTNPKLKALYAVKAAEEVAMAAQNVGKVAETLDALRSGDMQGTGTTTSPSVKISVSYGNQKQTQTSESQRISHQKSTLSTGTLNVKARDEKLSFEGVDANVKEMALSGKQGIEIKGVKDEEHQRTKNQSVGGSVGVFVGMNGNSYGFGLEGSVNAAKGKSNSDSERWQNSRLNADKIITNSEEGGLTLDAANLNTKRWEADLQSLTLTSRQDIEKYDSKQVSAGASGSIAYGSGGGASVNAAYSKASVDYRQVKEQTGIHIGEEGMNAVIHHHTQLNGAIIESEASPEKNRFKTGSLSHTDIENRSEIKTESASISAGSGGINPMQALSSALSLLGNSHESERSTTKSAISANINIETKTPENLTALSRDTKNANQQVNKQDLKKVQERQEMAKVIGEISNNAISIATYDEREKINKLLLEKFKLEEKYGKNHAQVQQLGEQINQIQANIDRTYGIGSPNGMAIRAVTAALQATAQNDSAGSLVALASPYLNQKIHEMTDGDTTKDKATNLIAHALLSAVEFQVTGKDPLTGAVAGVTGEATAELITRIYGKKPSELTANEKENISTLSQIAGGLAAALTAKANNTTEQQGGNFLTVTAGADTAKRAVENNFFDVDPHQDRLDDIKLFAKLYFNGDEEKAEAYYDAMQQGKSKGVKDNVVETAEALLNLDETVKSLAYAVTHPNEVIEQVYVSMDEWNQQYEYAVKHDPALAGEMQGYILGNFGSNPVSGMVVGAAGAKLLQKSAALVNKVKNMITPSTAQHTVAKLEIPTVLTCSFRGDMEVKTERGYQPISSIKIGDRVYAKNEVTGELRYQQVLAQYNNPYDYTVYVEVIDDNGKKQTIVSNKIHPFFTKVNQGELVPSSEGHRYKGDIENAQWVDAQNLKSGYKLLSENNQWQTVKGVSIKREKLSAYNLTVETDHTYFIKGAGEETDGVWVHNDCWHALPKGAKQVKDIDGYPAYQFKDGSGQTVTVLKKDLNRFETLNHRVGVDPHFNRLSQQIDAETGRYLSTGNAVDGLYNRSYLRSETMQKVFADYEKLPNGNYRDLDGNIIKAPIDIGHAYGWEHRRLSLAAKELNLTQKQFNDYVNARPERFRLENMSENRSHKNEMPGKDKIRPIVNDMKQFLKTGK